MYVVRFTDLIFDADRLIGPFDNRDLAMEYARVVGHGRIKSYEEQRKPGVSHADAMRLPHREAYTRPIGQDNETGYEIFDGEDMLAYWSVEEVHDR